MSSKKDAFCKMIEQKTGRLVVILPDNKVVVPTTVGETKEYGIRDFLSDYYSPDLVCISRFMSFLNIANEKAAKRLKGKLGFVNKCLDEKAEIYTLRLDNNRGSERLIKGRLLVAYDHVLKEEEMKKSFFNKKPRK